MKLNCLSRIAGVGLVLLLLMACAPAPSQPAGGATKPGEAAKPAEAAKPGAAAPAAPAAQAPASGDKLVVSLTAWGGETPWPWRQNQLDKALWDVMFDSLLMRDPKTFELKPGLATEYNHSADWKAWTFKLRQGIMFHGEWGEMTSDDVKFTVEQNLKPDSIGGDAGFFKQYLEKIELPDKYTVTFFFKSPMWEAPFHFSQMVGYMNIVSKKQVESEGEDKAAQLPAGTGPYKLVERQQGNFYRFEALPSHWRQTAGFKQLIIRKIGDSAAGMAALRAGEVDILPVNGDFLLQAKSAGFQIVESKNAIQMWLQLPGQTLPQFEDYCPQCPWVGDINDPKSQENAQKVRLAMNLAVNKQAIVDGLWGGYGSLTPFSYWYFPFQPGYSTEWKIPPYDPAKAKQLLTEAGAGNGFEIKMNPAAGTIEGAADVLEAAALDWEKVGIRTKRVVEDIGTFSPKGRLRKTGVVGRPYNAPSARDEPSLHWGLGINTKGTFNLLAEGPWDDKVANIVAELDPEKRKALTTALGNELYEQYRGVQIGMKSATWAISKRVGDWPVLAYTNFGSNYEYIKPAG